MAENSIWNTWPVDPAYVVMAMAAMMVILLIVTIVCIVKVNKVYRRYDYFMRGKDAETLEDIIMEQVEEIKRLKSEDKATKESIRSINRNLRASYQKFGMVRYNAFKGMGGNLSFVIAMLDYTNSGFVLNSVHSREGCFLYLKRVDMGQTDMLLGSEEKEALEQALGYVEY